MFIAVVGSRIFDKYVLLKDTLRKYLPFTLVSGGAIGADRLGEKFADEYGLEKIIYPAEWEKYGKSAGYIRNKQVVSKCDMLIAFWDGQSRGTKHAIDLVKRMGKKVIIVSF